ncbi:MAG: glycosyltransferase family 2 protein [Planctomycetota bacterium]
MTSNSTEARAPRTVPTLEELEGPVLLVAPNARIAAAVAGTLERLARAQRAPAVLVLAAAEAEGGLGATEGAVGRAHRLAERIAQRIEAHGARTVLVPPPGDLTPDHRAACVAASAAAPFGGARWVGFLGDGLEALVPAREAHSAARLPRSAGEPTVSAVISAWNKHDDVRSNLIGLRAQTRAFDDIVVVDNASTDATVAMLRADFPEARLVIMPNSAYGACETFNVGFSTAAGDRIAILDDDVVLTPAWLEATLARMAREPETTAVVSTSVIEPGMPDSYKNAPAVNTERYMSTFRGCASLARADALKQAGGYDVRLFLYGNERDLTCRLMNLGYRVLQFPGAETFHMTPFGIKMGKRSLYFHARNAWLSMLKYAPLGDLLRMPWLVVSKVLLRGKAVEAAGTVTDAVGTIGIGRAVRETKGAWWVLVKASASILWNVPYCLKRRAPVRHSDFELPLQ